MSHLFQPLRSSSSIGVLALCSFWGNSGIDKERSPGKAGSEYSNTASFCSLYDILDDNDIYDEQYCIDVNCVFCNHWAVSKIMCEVSSLIMRGDALRESDPPGPSPPQIILHASPHS
jgi:hypothetical protein